MESEWYSQLQAVGADPELTLDILERINRGTLVSPPVEVASFPGLDGKQVWDWRNPQEAQVSPQQAQNAFERYFPELDLDSYSTLQGNQRCFSLKSLEELGLRLSRRSAFGVLNGGMATSYGDAKKNQGLSEGLFQVYQKDFETLAEKVRGQPKGITPAFIQPDGTPGPSFLELKLRHLRLLNQASAQAGFEGPGLLLFQMTSEATDAPLREALERYQNSDYLIEGAYPLLLKDTPTRVQNLLGTFTSLRDGLPRRLFFKNGLPYALPGGHGQNFRVLADLYQSLFDKGYRFFWLGNVDNLGNLPSLKSLALLALTGAPAAFDFSFKTPVDVKGGVLYRRPEGKLDCADIGVGLDGATVRAAEEKGHPILFNCATGLFHLETILKNLSSLIQRLPVRVSEQDKDLGHYAQAELNTWEVIGLLDHPLILGVEKKQRFLAAKLLTDSLLTSALHRDHPWFAHEGQTWAQISDTLHEGLTSLLAGPYAMKLEKGRWVPDAQSETSGLFV